jgi:hypothetical protein
MSQIVRNECLISGSDAAFEIVTTPNKKQQLAYDLLKNITM